MAHKYVHNASSRTFILKLQAAMATSLVCNRCILSTTPTCLASLITISILGFGVTCPGCGPLESQTTRSIGTATGSLSHKWSSACFSTAKWMDGCAWTVLRLRCCAPRSTTSTGLRSWILLSDQENLRDIEAMAAGTVFAKLENGSSAELRDELGGSYIIVAPVQCVCR